MVRDLPEPQDAHLRTVRQLLQERESAYDDRPFLRFEDRAITYRQLSAASDRIAAALHARGLRPGDRVAIWMRNRPEYIELLFAVAKAGFVAVTVNPALRAVDGQYLLEDSHARAVVLGPEVLDAYRDVRERLDGIEHEFVVGTDTANLTPFAALREADAAPVPDPGVDAASPLSIIYTSGTTGLPKGVVLPHGAYVNTARWYGEHVIEADSRDVFFTCLPLYHCNAQIFTLATALVRRSRVAMVERFSASRFLDQLRHYDATVFNFIGMMLVALHKQPERSDDGDNPATRAFGIPIPPDLGRSVERRFQVALLEGYGATETGCGFVFNTVTERRLGWAGRAMPYAEVRVVGPAGDPVPPGEVGRIEMRPTRPHVWMQEYFNKPDKTEQAWASGWLTLDDYGVLDEEGWLAFRGRGLDWVRRRGENISALEVENVCLDHPDVDRCAVVAAPSEVTEEEVKLFVQWREGASPDPGGLWSWLGERLAAFKLPRYIESVATIPTTATGKIAKFRLDRSAEAGWVADDASLATGTGE